MKDNIILILFFIVLLLTFSCNPNLTRDKLSEKCIEFDLLYENSEFIDETSYLQLNIYNETLKKTEYRFFNFIDTASWHKKKITFCNEILNNSKSLIVLYRYSNLLKVQDSMHYIYFRDSIIIEQDKTNYLIDLRDSSILKRVNQE